jgi:hypothetical protein
MNCDFNDVYSVMGSILDTFVPCIFTFVSCILYPDSFCGCVYCMFSFCLRKNTSENTFFLRKNKNQF